ncbi:hypothetical protein [Micromonospora sp. NPDC049374]|uniref:hypothetical protein n=1 Tax=Micromonospora sp. NPDC049374 TaxID=3154352 RepID=UPI0034209985
MTDSEEPSVSSAGQPTGPAGGGGPEPDVLLDVPKVSVNSIQLSVDRLDADLSLRARLAGLLQLDAGVRVHVEGVELDIEGVEAQALLKVRLEKLVTILDRALTTIDRNPQVIDVLANTANAVLEDVNRAAGEAASASEQLAATVGPAAGQAAGRPDPALGRTRPVDPAAVRFAGPATQPPTRSGRPVGGPEEVAGPSSRAAGGAGPVDGQPGGATDELGQQVGAVGAVADRTAGREPDDRDQSRGRERKPDQGRDQGQARGEGRQAGRGDDETAPPEHGPPGPGGTSGTRQLAEQAGETLLQAGRSVWEAIQSGVTQHRQQDR